MKRGLKHGPVRSSASSCTPSSKPPNEEGTETLTLKRTRVPSLTSSKPPNEEGTETRSARTPVTVGDLLPRSPPMKRGLKLEVLASAAAATASSKPPNEEGTETGRTQPVGVMRAAASSKPPNEEGTETTRSRRPSPPRALPRSPPMKRGLKRELVGAGAGPGCSSSKPPNEEGTETRSPARGGAGATASLAA